MAHFAHYIARRLVQAPYRHPRHPWFARNRPEDQDPRHPLYHVTRGLTGPAARVRAGDTIWLFSQLRTPWGELPPSLDAKLVVACVARCERHDGGASLLRYGAAVGSRWFPLHDARPLLQQLETICSTGKVSSLLSGNSGSVGRALQSMRELASPALLEAFEARVAALGFDFISYRLIDGTRLAFDKCRELVCTGQPVFWDRWSLPRRVAERREFLDDAVLEGVLRDQIEACRRFWIIDTPRYGERGSYTERELMAATALGKAEARPMHRPGRTSLPSTMRKSR